MRTLNRVFLMGSLGQTPKLTMSKTGKPYTRLSLATHRFWTNAEDQREEKTEWHSVFVWGKMAEHCTQNLRKGALVFVEGSLSYWQVAEQKDYKNAIHGIDVKFLQSSRFNESLNGIPTVSDEVAAEDLDNPLSARNHNAVAHPA